MLLGMLLLLQAAPAVAFGAGNIGKLIEYSGSSSLLIVVASISKIEGHNWRHGDIEDMLKTVAFIKGHKWTSMMVKRVYFGNWLRDYSQAVDVGTLKGVQGETMYGAPHSTKGWQSSLHSRLEEICQNDLGAVSNGR